MSSDEHERFIEKRKEVLLRARETTHFSDPVLDLKNPKARFPGFKQGARIFKAGQSVEAGARPFPVDTIMHESVPFQLSDGVTIYFDVFLPARFDKLNSSAMGTIPAIVCWSPYGKQKGQQVLDDFPLRAGVPKHMVSETQKWEAPDPAEWIQYGYAIVNPDCRGCWTSEGDFEAQGYGEAFDCAELIEWLAVQPWCNGKVGLAGNSWLGLTQWKVASLRPKGLAAIAPWEGLSDLYRDSAAQGGILASGFATSIMDGITGPGQFEDWRESFNKHPLYDEWWDNKRAFPEFIQTPTYCVASWTNMVHTAGTFNAFRTIPDTTSKWLRVHNTQEWSDFYTHQDDLRRFFDHYLLNRRDNGWDATARYRLTILDLGDSEGDILNRPEREFPLKRTKYVDYYLRKDNTLSLNGPEEMGSEVSYCGQTESACFSYRFSHNQETTGYWTLNLSVSTDIDDMDIYVQVEKYDSKGYRRGTQTIRPEGVKGKIIQQMQKHNIGLGSTGMLFHWGPDGAMRVSHAATLDPTQSQGPHLFFKHDSPQKLIPREIRAVQIPLRPYAMFWKAGDEMRLTIKGSSVIPFPLPEVKPPPNPNQGPQRLHLSGCSLTVPHIPY